jgi:HEAT repeat protein
MSVRGERSSHPDRATTGGRPEIGGASRAGVVPLVTMRRSPAPDDFHGWVAQLGVSSCRPRAKYHLMTSGPSAVPAIQRGLRHEKPIVRRICVNLLDRLVDDESVSDLVRALDDEAPEVSARALHALACDRCKQNECRPGEDLWVPRAVEFLRTSTNPDLRAAAIDALGKVVPRRPDVAAVLRAAAETDPDRGLRGMARRYVN